MRRGSSVSYPFYAHFRGCLSDAASVWTAVSGLWADKSRRSSADRAFCCGIFHASVYLCLAAFSVISGILPLYQRLQTKRSTTASDRDHCCNAPVLWVSYAPVLPGCRTDGAKRCAFPIGLETSAAINTAAELGGD